MSSSSLERLGTTVYAYLTPIGPTGARSRGQVLADFGVQFKNPAGADISSATAITVDEYDAGESETRGSYRFAVPLPATGEGNYELRLIDEFGDKSYCVFMAYDFPPHTNTGDDTAQIEIEAFEPDGTAVTTLAIGDIDLYIFNPSMEDIADESYVDATLTKLEDGRFLVEFDCSTAEGEWWMEAVHSTYFSGGQFAIWLYRDPVDYATPTIDDVDISADGLTVTLDMTKGDAPYVVAKLLGAAGEVRDEDIRTGSGQMVLTRATDESGMVVAYGADKDGFPAGDSIGQVITASATPSGGADDNVVVAIRTMKTTAVYWAVGDVDEFGQPTSYSDAVLITCRWDIVREEFIGPSNGRELSNARLIVDRDITIKSVVMLGTLADVTNADDPKENAGAWEVRTFEKTADFKGSRYLREVYL